jgi:hypothetical protein
MSTKLEVLQMLERAADDEPVFVLRGNDELAPGAIEDWVRRAHISGMHTEKLADAMATARAMRIWQSKNQGASVS